MNQNKEIKSGKFGEIGNMKQSCQYRSSMTNNDSRNVEVSNLTANKSAEITIIIQNVL